MDAAAERRTQPEATALPRTPHHRHQPAQPQSTGRFCCESKGQRLPFPPSALLARARTRDGRGEVCECSALGAVAERGQHREHATSRGRIPLTSKHSQPQPTLIHSPCSPCHCTVQQLSEPRTTPIRRRHHCHLRHQPPLPADQPPTAAAAAGSPVSCARRPRTSRCHDKVRPDLALLIALRAGASLHSASLQWHWPLAADRPRRLSDLSSLCAPSPSPLLDRGAAICARLPLLSLLVSHRYHGPSRQPALAADELRLRCHPAIQTPPALKRRGGGGSAATRGLCPSDGDGGCSCSSFHHTGRDCLPGARSPLSLSGQSLLAR